MAARGAQGLIAVTALVGLAACGSVSAGSTGHPPSASVGASNTSAAGTPAGGTLCADGHSANGHSADGQGADGHSANGHSADGHGADRVVVSRTASPRQVTLTGTTQVRTMVAALCALPPMPAGHACPVTSGGSVRLVFATGQQSFPPVTVQESGCRSVTGMGATRWWSGSSQLSVLLDEAVGGLGRLMPGTHPSSVPLGS
jgi:hypothetical protein